MLSVSEGAPARSRELLDETVCVRSADVLLPASRIALLPCASGELILLGDDAAPEDEDPPCF